MILAYADASVDTPIVSVGYILYRVDSGTEELLETGTRVLNADSHDRDIEWCSTRAEYFGAIVATRACLDYTSEPFVLHLDAEHVVRDIKQRTWNGEPYFPHCLFSFLERFDDYHVRVVHRENNKRAHEQARVGLKVGRDIQRGVL
jgi:hypothetical protein